MRYMLDTDTCSYLIKQSPLSVLKSMDKTTQHGHEIIISSITYAELMLGAKRVSESAYKNRLLHKIHELCERLHEICSWDKQAADQYSDLQTDLLNNGTPIGANDTLIAAHALSVQATLVTNNTKHFSKVPDIKLENWVEKR